MMIVISVMSDENFELDWKAVWHKLTSEPNIPACTLVSEEPLNGCAIGIGILDDEAPEFDGWKPFWEKVARAVD